jgi:hypothetical protein
MRNIHFDKYYPDMCVMEFSYSKNVSLYWVNYDFETKKSKVIKPIALSKWQERKVESEDLDEVRKILVKMENKKYKGFYDSDVKLACEVFGVKL